MMECVNRWEGHLPQIIIFTDIMTCQIDKIWDMVHYISLNTFINVKNNSMNIIHKGLRRIGTRKDLIISTYLYRKLFSNMHIWRFQYFRGKKCVHMHHLKYKK